MADKGWAGPGEEPEALFARRVKQERERLGWTQDRLARAVSKWWPMRQVTIATIEPSARSGRKIPGRPIRLNEAIAIANALEETVSRLLLTSDDVMSAAREFLVVMELQTINHRADEAAARRSADRTEGIAARLRSAIDEGPEAVAKFMARNVVGEEGDADGQHRPQG